MTTDNENPYLTARRTWNSHTGDLVAINLWLKQITMMSLMVSLVAVGGALYICSIGEKIPYIVEVDTVGQVRFAGVMAPVDKFDEKIVESTLRNFVFHARLVTQDDVLQNHAILTVFAHLERGSEATEKMRNYIKSRDDRRSVTVELAGVLKINAQTWQVEWSEYDYGLNGRQKGSSRMRAIMTVEKKEIANLNNRDLARNPLGLIVLDFSWTRIDE